MRIHLVSRLPSRWTGHPHAKGLIHEANLRIGFSRLAAKLLVFDTKAQLRAFWTNGLGKPSLGRNCFGAVIGLHSHHEIVGKDAREWIECDRRYFCVIGLVKSHLSMEVISHEAVHAAYCYAKRIHRSPWDAQAIHFDEEAVAYPAGAIARQINNSLHRAKLY